MYDKSRRWHHHNRNSNRGGGNTGNNYNNNSFRPHYKQQQPRRASDRPQSTAEALPVNLSFGNFDTQELKSLGKRGGGVRELTTLLRHARRRVKVHGHLLQSRDGLEVRNAELLSAAMQRAAGMKVKDDPQRLAKALAKRRQKKRQSAKKWAKRIENLQASVDNVVKDRTIQRQNMRARREAKKAAKEAKKGGRGGKAGGKNNKQVGRGRGGGGGNGGAKGKRGGGRGRQGGGKKRGRS